MQCRVTANQQVQPGVVYFKGLKLSYILFQAIPDGIKQKK